MVTGKLPVGCCHWRKGQRHSYSVLTNHCSWRLLSAGFCSRSPISLHALNVCQEHFPSPGKGGQVRSQAGDGSFCNLPRWLILPSQRVGAVAAAQQTEKGEWYLWYREGRLFMKVGFFFLKQEGRGLPFRSQDITALPLLFLLLL